MGGELTPACVRVDDRRHVDLVKGVVDQLGFETTVGGDQEADDGKADRPPPAGEQPVLGGGLPKGASLACTDGFVRRAEGVAGPGLDLDHHQLAATPAEQVDLAPPGAEARTDELVTAPAQELGGGFLARLAQL